MKKLPFYLFLIFTSMVIFACEKVNKAEPQDEENETPELTETQFIANYKLAKEEVLRKIPEEYINTARENLHIAYQHTSHGTHVSYGMFGLPDYKEGDEILFAISNKNRTTGKLDFNDNVLKEYASDGEDASDLSRNETAFIQATRNYLDDPENAHINVIMWSWCNIKGHDVEGNYLPGVQTLMSEYGIGGAKIGSGEGQRAKAITFILMTGHANKDDNEGSGKPKDQAKLITDFCDANKMFCLDYFSIDSHCMDDNYWEDVSDDAYSDAYGGNFYLDWQNAHVLGVDFYNNKKNPGGDVSFGAHNTQHITANRKAFAMWWILARIAGWNGVLQDG